MPKSRNVIGGDLDSKHRAELVVYLDTGRFQAVLDAAPFKAGAQARADFLDL